jgi:hypothetical protein
VSPLDDLRHRGGPANPEEAEVARQVAGLADRIEQLSGRRPSYVPDTGNRDAGCTFYRYRDGTYSYEAFERGRECFGRRTTSRHELLGWIASDLARDVATRHELEHRVEGQDSRRAWFAMWEELTAALDPEWGARVRQHVAETLARAPYRDA